MSEPQPRPVEPSVSVDQPPREQCDDSDMADPDSDRRRPREPTSLRENKAMMQTWAILRVTGRDPESRLGRKEKQRESGSMSLMVKKAMNGWRLKRNGCESTVVPDEVYSLSITLKVDLS